MIPPHKNNHHKTTIIAFVRRVGFVFLYRCDDILFDIVRLYGRGVYRRIVRVKGVVALSMVARWQKRKRVVRRWRFKRKTIGTTTYYRDFQRKVKDRMTMRIISLRAVGAGFGILILFLSLATSQFYSVNDLYAEIKPQNFVENTSTVGPGLEMLSYETRAENTKTTKADFDSGTYSNGQFLSGHDDVASFVASDDYLTLGHYGAYAPDTSENDWWDDDGDSSTKYHWRYRKCFTIDNSASADALIEYPIYLSVDTATLVGAGKMLASGDDIRFTNNDGDVLPFQIADDMNSASTRFWVQVDHIASGAQEDLCMYYGYIGSGTPPAQSNQEAVFRYSTPKDIYYVVADRAEGSKTQFSSYADGNDVSVANYTKTLTAYESDIYPTNITTLTQTSAISTTKPINATYNANGTDNLVPAHFAGEHFVYRMDRYTNQFSFISPWCDADVEVRNENNALVANGSFTIAQGTMHNLSTNNSAGNGIANDSAVIVDVTNNCPILAQHHSNNGGDSFVMHPAEREWYGVGSGNIQIAALNDNTSVTLYRSSGASNTYTLQRGENVMINDAGSQGSDPAHHVVADQPIGVGSLADGDGGEATTFLPVEEMGYRYYIADDTQYIAIATRAGITTTVDLYNDATVCDNGAPDETQTVSPTGNNPGKVYFGATSAGNHIPAGACIVADEPIVAYNEYNGAGDEHNIWNEVQNRQFVGAVPTQSFGAEEIGQWHLDATHTWIRRTPITITNTTATAVNDYQVHIDLSTVTTSGFFDKTQVDGGDIRIAGVLGDGTDDIVYALDTFDRTSATGDLWVRVPSIPANGSTTFYMYYSPIGVDVAGLGSVLWLDGADSATITQTASRVSQWNDKSGNSNDVTQSANARKPEVTIDNGHQVLDFATDYMRDDSGLFGTASYDDSYVFVVMKNKVLPENGALFYEPIVGPGSSRYSANAPWGTEVRYYPNAGTNAASRLSGVYGGDTTTYHTVRFEAHNGGARAVSRDGVLLVGDTNGTSFTGNGGSFTVGAYASGARMQDMYLGEMIVIPTALTPTQVQNVEAYLTQKWISGPTTTLTTTGDHMAVFTTTAPVPNYYIVDQRALSEQLSIISFADDNHVNDTVTTQTLSEGQIATLPFGDGIAQTDVYRVTRPLHIDFDADATDSAVPIGYAGKEFVYNVGRNNDVFSFYAPFGDAQIQIQQSGATGWTTLQSVMLSAGNGLTVAQNITNNHAFKIVSDEPILAFHRNQSYDSKILYPTHLALEPNSGKYELYGIGSSSLRLASASDATVTLYRSDGTQSTITLNAGNNFVYSESGGGAQGDSRGYHIVSDVPIGATSYADADGGETAVFVSQREFSDTYVLSSPVQYMSIVTRDPGVTCRVYDALGVEVTSGPGAMDHVPPQTSTNNALPYPNRLHIGGNDTSDPAFFSAGYRMQCDAPVYAYYEQHVGGLKTDETSWLSWPQGRTRNALEPQIADVDTAQEEGLYFESGFDSGSAGTDAEATATYLFDVSGIVYGGDTYWRDLLWEEVVSDRSGENAVEQITLEVAYADPTPTCSSATYSAFAPLTAVTVSSSSSTTLAHETRTTQTKRGMIAGTASDHSCIKVRATVRTGDEAFAPALNNLRVGYYVPTVLEGQTDTPTINIDGATSGMAQEYRILKVRTNDTGLANSEAFMTYHDVSTPGVFSQADFDLVEEGSLTTHSQFQFPPFPSVSPTSAGNHTPFDSTHATMLYVTHERSLGSVETIDLSFDVDIATAGGPVLSRDVSLSFSGL